VPAPYYPDSHSGLRVGDVLMSVGDRELRSITALYAAISDSRASGVIVLHAVRGVDSELDATLDLRPRPDDEPAPGHLAPATGVAKHAF